MPLAVREGSGMIGYAYYYFDESFSSTHPESHPWLRKPGSEDYLCEICRQLDFRFLFSQLLSETPIPASKNDPGREITLYDGIHLGTIQDMRNKPDCSFCSLALTALDEGHPNGRAPSEIRGKTVECVLLNVVRGLHNTSPFQLDGNEDDFPGNIQIRFRLDPKYAMVGDQEEAGYSQDRSNRKPIMVQVVADERDADGSPRPGKCVSELVDFSQIAGWLASCENLAEQEDSEEPKSGISTLLIDVNRNCIVGPLQDVPYVALSYVWGKTPQLMCKMDSLEALRQENSLSLDDERIPRTIRDAILLCKNLERPYLWVDSLCITQDSPQKLELINRMDDIYRDADFTIVAAEGEDANAGLPGLPTTERTVKQKILTIEGLKMALTLPELDFVVHPSTWNHRGWTFQERLFSRRKLIFTGEQMYLDCAHGEMSENFDVDIHGYELKPRDSYTELSKYHINIPGKLNFLTYSQIVEVYTKRTLGYPQDILNAFAGIENEMSKHLFNKNSPIHGIPLPILEIGLLWHPASVLRRRCDEDGNAVFGSWSWAGWVGEVCYPSTDNASDTTISRMKWLDATKLQDGIQEPLPPDVTGKPSETWPEWSQWSRITSESQNYEYIHNDDPEGTRFSHPISPPRSQNTDLLPSPFDPKTGHLHLLAETAKLTITTSHAESLFLDPRCEENDHHVCQLSIHDAEGTQAGIVIVDGNTYATLKPGLQTFIKLSQRTLTADSTDPAWDEAEEKWAGVPGEPGLQEFVQYGPGEDLFDEEKYEADVCWGVYNVLMVEWEEKRKVWCRMGIGKVHIHAFDGAGPEWERIELG